MSDNNDNELGFTRNLINGFRERTMSRVTAFKENQANEHKILTDIAETINRNSDKIKNSQQFNAPFDPKEIPKDMPAFMANAAKEDNRSINDLLKSKGQEQEKAHSKGETQKEGVEEPKEPIVLLDKKKVRGLAKTLKARVFGQDSTIDEVVDVLTVAALDIKINEAKPAGCYFYAGPSGVGKTELAQSIADQLGVPLLKVNMGEYGQEQDVSKLIGAAAGLVGFKEGGLLTNFVQKNPASVVLFDEIEKADRSIDNILLSIMDHGICGANDGTEVAFKNTIVICTSNLGAEVEYYPDLTKEEKDKLRMDFIKDGMRPEIINRYDSIFHFNALTPDIYKLVADKFLKKLSSNMSAKHGFEVKFSPKLIDFMVEKSYDPAMGGRPARRFIEKIMIKPLARYMLEDEFEAVAKEHKEITLDLNAKSNVCFKGKNKKILGVLDNTSELVAEFEAGKFTNKKEAKGLKM